MRDGADAAYWRDQALRCRRLADSVPNAIDAATLRKSAADFEAQAAAVEARDRAGLNGVAPQIKPVQD